MPSQENVSIEYINGHKGYLINEGVYKVEKPFRIKIKEWINNEENRGYAFIGMNYSDDITECDIIYFSINNYSLLGDYIIYLNQNDPIEYGYSECVYTNYQYELLGGQINIDI